MNLDINKKLVRAETLIASGQLVLAQQYLSEVLSLDPVHRQALSGAARVCYQQGLEEEKKSRVKAAYKLFARAVLYDPGLKPARDKLLSLLPGYLQAGNAAGATGSVVRKRKKPGRLVLGMGTGRSGSTSLARLLSLQPGCYVGHEHPPLLPWEPDRKILQFHIERFRRLLAMFSCAGDVAHWWLPYLETLLKKFPGMRVVCTRRSKQATVRSFESIKGEQGTGLNHWVEHKGVGWKEHIWDRCYPKYPSENRAEAIGFYWDEYYVRAMELADRYPDNILVCDMEDMNTIPGQEGILRFCGFDHYVTEENPVLNRGSVADGQELF